jgi:hypothetical protein
VGVKRTITYYPLKMLDGLFHIFARTEVTSSKIEIEDTGILPFDDYNSANEKATDLNDWREDAYFSDIQGS